MSKIWFTSDTHFCHSKEFLWKPRGFDTNIQHDCAILENWNNWVAPDDEVYLLGDVMLENDELGIQFLGGLNGHIHIAIGNHDTENRIEKYKKCGNVVEIFYAKRIKIGKLWFWLCHYPTITAQEDGGQIDKHIINLFGHTHQKEKFYNNNPYMYCVGLDAHDNRPIELQEIIEDIKKKKEELNSENSNLNN